MSQESTILREKNTPSIICETTLLKFLAARMRAVLNFLLFFFNFDSTPTGEKMQHVFFHFLLVCMNLEKKKRKKKSFKLTLEFTQHMRKVNLKKAYQTQSELELIPC